MSMVGNQHVITLLPFDNKDLLLLLLAFQRYERGP